jgi:uncharacterized membrane protein
MTAKMPPEHARIFTDGRRRLMIAGAAGLLAYLAARWMAAPNPSHVLIGWNIAVIAYLSQAWRLFLTADSAAVKRTAEREDESRTGLLAIVLCLVLASLVAIVQAMIGVKDGPAAQRALVAGLAGVTLVSSWLLLQSVFVLHYAHRHFGAADGHGFDFPGEPAKDYMDFVYLSFCIGATFQVSDTTVKTARLRNLITAHASIAYLFNTAILALGINIIAGLVGK